MVDRYSPTEYYNAIMKDYIPELSFIRWQDKYALWKGKSLATLKKLLGDFPARVPLNPLVLEEWVEGELRISKIRLTTDKYSDLPALIMRRVDLEPGVGHPAILCIHGHGHQGKDSVAGMVEVPGVREDLAAMKNDYGRQMAIDGFITMMPDLRGFGERHGEDYPDRDRCNVNFLKGAMLGVFPLTLDIWDLMCCLDYLGSLPEVEPSRIGAMGLSFGGTLTTFLTALDPRIKAADIIGYINPFYEFAIKRANFCGSQMVPFLFKYFDTADIAGLIAPRPLLLEMGKDDLCFLHADQQTGYLQLARIYQVAGCGSLLEVDDHPGGHEYSGRKAREFFRSHL